MPGVNEETRIAEGDVALRQTARCTDPGQLAVQRAALAGGGSHRLADAREVGNADLDPSVDLQADQDAVQGHAADEGTGAVDRVDIPVASSSAFRVVRAVARPELFADDRVAWEGLGDPGADQLLGAAVGLGDGRAIALEFRLDAEPEELKRQLPGDPGGLDRKVELGLIVGRHPRSLLERLDRPLVAVRRQRDVHAVDADHGLVGRILGPAAHEHGLRLRRG